MHLVHFQPQGVQVVRMGGSAAAVAVADAAAAVHPAAMAVAAGFSPPAEPCANDNVLLFPVLQEYKAGLQLQYQLMHHQVIQCLQRDCDVQEYITLKMHDAKSARWAIVCPFPNACLAVVMMMSVLCLHVQF